MKRPAFRFRRPAAPEPARADQPDGLWLWRGALWTPCAARKSTECERTGATIGPGDRVWRPLGNGDARMFRVKSWS
jgi:hypothetical protein